VSDDATHTSRTEAAAPPAAEPKTKPDAPAMDAELAGETEAAVVQARDARIALLESENEKLKDQALRALADAENTRRRGQREMEETQKYAISNIVRDLLSVADKLRRALDALPAGARAGDKNIEQLAAGIELTERELLAAFERHHVKRIDPAGAIFDPHLHQAMMEVETADQPPGTVVKVFQAGFTLQGRLLRPALVTVAKAPAAAAPPANAETPA